MSFPFSPPFEVSTQDSLDFIHLHRTDTFSLAEEEFTPTSSPYFEPNLKPIYWCALIPQGPLSFSKKPTFISEFNCTLGRVDFSCENSNFISVNHLRLCFDHITGKKSIVDTSSNGIFLNGSRLPKNKPFSLENGDIIALRVGRIPVDTIQFEFLDLSTYEIENSNIETKSTQGYFASPNFSQTEAESTLKCNICLETLHDPVALYPCIHNVCSCCFTHLYKNFHPNLNCPACREEVTGIQWNYPLSNITHKLLKTHPSLNRSESFVSASRSSREFIQKLIDEKTLERDTIPAKRYRPNLPPIPNNTVTPPPSDDTCRTCSTEVHQDSSVADLPGHTHVSCQLCSENMPNQYEPRQSCFLCNKYFCNQFWDCSFPNAYLEFNRLSSFSPTEFPLVWQSQDPLEEELYKHYLEWEAWEPQKLFQFCMEKFQSGDYLWHQSKLNLLDANLNSFVCRTCVTDTVFPEFGLFHRLSLAPSELTSNPNLLTRPHCPSGRECPRVVEDHPHRLKYNHWCLPLYSPHTIARRSN